jgi:hypothetical protein
LRHHRHHRHQNYEIVVLNRILPQIGDGSSQVKIPTVTIVTLDARLVTQNRWLVTVEKLESLFCVTHSHR